MGIPAEMKALGVSDWKSGKFVGQQNSSQDAMRCLDYRYNQYKVMAFGNSPCSVLPLKRDQQRKDARAHKTDKQCQSAWLNARSQNRTLQLDNGRVQDCSECIRQQSH
jgi:hypothetical protein